VPIVGYMSHYPNVLLNLGHGGHGTTISFACAKLVADIVNMPEIPTFTKEIYDFNSPRRCFV
jgi:glycine/D-amino acid oxidase-like deaminating enzyme